MLVLIRWQGRTMAVLLSQLAAVKRVSINRPSHRRPALLDSTRPLFLIYTRLQKAHLIYA